MNTQFYLTWALVAGTTVIIALKAYAVHAIWLWLGAISG